VIILDKTEILIDILMDFFANKVNTRLEGYKDIHLMEYKRVYESLEKLKDKNSNNKKGTSETTKKNLKIKDINLDYPAKIIKFKFKSEKDLEEFYKFYKSVMR
jgi:hypothetical protein